MASILLTACTLGQLPPGQQACTLIACGSSLEIALVGDHVPTVFSMQISSPSGELINVHCADGNARFDPAEAARWSPACPSGGVSLTDFAPQQLSVTVDWSDGQARQEFQPSYVASQPNGPACEPTCRSARIEVRIPKILPYGDVSTWEVYTDEEHGFSVRHPAELTLEIGPSSGGNRIVFVGDKIQVRTTTFDPLVCQGECPMIESNEAITIAGRPARIVRGYIGSIGGNIPQHFMLYLIRSGDIYISLILYAESRNALLGDPAVIVPLQQADIELFDRIVQTLEIPY